MCQDDSMLSFQVKPVCAGDAAALHANCYPELTLEDVARRVEQDMQRRQNGTGLCLVVEVEGEPVAAGLMVCVAGRIGHLCNIVVNEPFRGQGMLRALIGEFERLAGGYRVGRLQVSVESSNAGALKAYAKLGFGRLRDDGDVVWLEKRVGR